MARAQAEAISNRLRPKAARRFSIFRR